MLLGGKEKKEPGKIIFQIHFGSLKRGLEKIIFRDPFLLLIINYTFAFFFLSSLIGLRKTNCLLNISNTISESL